MSSKSYLWSALLLSLVLVGFLLFTNPESVAVGLLIVPAVLFMLIVFCLIQATFITLKVLKNNLFKQRLVALVAASYATVVVILHSASGLSLADVILLILVLVVSSLYISRI